MWEGELDRIEGELKQVHGASATEIETCFQQAIAITRTQGGQVARTQVADEYEVARHGR